MSPYGVPNEKPEQTKWLESCVESVMKSNPDYDQARAISICKNQLKRNNWKVPKSDSEIDKQHKHRRITWGNKTI